MSQMDTNIYHCKNAFCLFGEVDIAEEGYWEMKNDHAMEKTKRVLGIYERLMDGYAISIEDEAERYGVDKRSIHRDISEIRSYLDYEESEDGVINEVVYDRQEKKYRLEQIYRTKFSNIEILAVCKILLDSRAFVKEDMETLVKKLIDCCVPEKNRKLVSGLISNELFHYVEPRHHKRFIENLWKLGQAIQSSSYIEITYQKLKGRECVTRILRPAAIMFSEYYFYLTAFIDDKETKEHFDVVNDSFPTIYRVDRIQELKVLEERFHTPYRDRFEEGEFRKRVQFMYGGKLQKVKFKYSGVDIDAVLDRLPTAEVLEETDGVYTVSAEVFGTGIEMWFRSQGEAVEVAG